MVYATLILAFTYFLSMNHLGKTDWKNFKRWYYSCIHDNPTEQVHIQYVSINSHIVYHIVNAMTES